MPQDKNDAVADFLNLSPQDPFKEQVIEVEEVPEEEKEEVEEEKPLPFNQDPKVQRFIDKQVEKRMKDFKPEVQRFQESVKEDDINLPPALVKLVGNDTPEKREALKELSAYLDSLPAKAQEQFQAKLAEEQQQKLEQDNAALQELNAGIEEIEENFNVDLSSKNGQKTRYDFISYLRKVSHKNEDGEVDQFADIPAAWEEFQDKAKKSNSVAKKLASRSIGSSQSASEAPQGRDYSWKGVEKMFSTLGK